MEAQKFSATAPLKESSFKIRKPTEPNIWPALDIGNIEANFFRHTLEHFMGLLLIIVVLVLLFGGGGYWGYNRGYYGSGGHSLIWLLVVIVVLVVLFGHGHYGTV
jgi:hypothetical protein